MLELKATKTPTRSVDAPPKSLDQIRSQAVYIAVGLIVVAGVGCWLVRSASTWFGGNDHSVAENDHTVSPSFSTLPTYGHNEAGDVIASNPKLEAYAVQVAHGIVGDAGDPRALGEWAYGFSDRAQIRLRQGDRSGALADCEVLIRMAELLGQSSKSPVVLMSSAAVAVVAVTVEAGLDGGWDESQLVLLQSALSKLRPLGSYMRILPSEVRMCLIAGSRSDSQQVGGYRLDPARSHREQELAQQIGGKWINSWDPFANNFRGASSLYSHQGFRDPGAQAVVALSGVILEVSAVECKLRQVAARLAAERYQLRYGSSPSSADDLVPWFCQEQQRPVHPVSGRPLDWMSKVPKARMPPPKEPKPTGAFSMDLFPVN